jgi:uncharacterized membrane protein
VIARAASWIVTALLGALLLIGIAGAVNRGAAVAGDDPSWLDRQQLDMISALTGTPPRSAEHARLEGEIARSAANLNSHPRGALTHLAAGALLFVLVPLQFSRTLRSRHPAVHRWNGRALLVLATATGAAGIYLGLGAPYGGAVESSATAVFGGFFLFAAARGYVAVRRRDIARHREWMIRMFATAIGISVIRVVGMAHFIAFGTEAINPRGFALGLWFGWILTLAVAELWILRSRPRRAAESGAALQPL